MRLWLALWFVMGMALSGLAQTTQEQLLAIDSAFVKGQYPQVELLTLRLLQSPAELTPQERARVNLTAGYALIMQGREQEAKEYFHRALDAEPSLVLDPVQVSPKFRVVFDEVKAAHQAATPQNKLEPSVRESGPSKRAMISNLFVPGSGQWREGHPIRGSIFLLAQAASVAAFIYELGHARDTHEDYLAESDPVRIHDAYDTYNQHYQLSWGAGALMGLVYVAAQADLILHRHPEQKVAFQPVLGQNPGISLSVRW